MTCHGKLISIADLPPPSEAEITATIRDYLRLIGCWELKVHGHLGQRAGVPDLIACLPPAGRLVAVEVKRPGGAGNRGGSVTREQRAELTAIARAGGIAIVARDLDDVRAVLEPLGLARVTVEAP
jgi:hypothetical protein